MSDRDPSIYSPSQTPLMHKSNIFNPTASSYAPGSQPRNSMASQVSAPPFPYPEARVLNLEQEHSDLRHEMDLLKEIYHDLFSPMGKLKKGGWPVTVAPFQEQDPAQSHQSAMKLKQELEQLSREVHESVDDGADVEKVNGGASDASGPKSLPPHLRKKAMNGTPECSAVTSPNNRLVTDGPVDIVTKALVPVPAPMPSPPTSPVTIVQQDLPIKQLSLAACQPHYLTTLSPLSKDTTNKIHTASTMVTFHPQFLEEHLGGVEWSPGLRFIPGDSTCILKNRTYYTLNPSTEPYLPKHPGQHGAKLTAFFNTNPEDVHGDLPDDATSYEHVPMFVEQNGRYAYFGNYSQTRWSDKLDYDSMEARVPQHIKEYWAEELTSPIRQDWVTEALKNHFFKKPEYDGRIYPAFEDDAAATVNSEEEVKINNRMAKDVHTYVEELREWEREAKMKTAMIKKQFILDAFDAADADDPPALRLWWEYLECVDWRKDFYDLLVTLQSREERFAK